MTTVGPGSFSAPGARMLRLLYVRAPRASSQCVFPCSCFSQRKPPVWAAPSAGLGEGLQCTAWPRQVSSALSLRLHSPLGEESGELQSPTRMVIIKILSGCIGYICITAQAGCLNGVETLCLDASNQMGLYA